MRLISAIKPTGFLTLGNYIGLIRNLEKIQNDFDEILIFIADLHALTFPIEPHVLMENSKKIAAFFLASNLDKKKIKLFLQSDVNEHAELNAILQNFLYIGELSRMTQFKDKKDQSISLSLGFFAYPSLMCADILLYNADAVPVGEDQKQHVELARNLVKRFNNYYGQNVFTQPKTIINKVGYKIMDLKNPRIKMSKSSTQSGSILISDSDEVIVKKIMSAVTDNDSKIRYDVENKPGISNLLAIYASLKNMNLNDCEKHFENYKYNDFKKEVAVTVVDQLKEIKQNYCNILKDESFIRERLNDGANGASSIAKITLKKVKKIVGFYGK